MKNSWKLIALAAAMVVSSASAAAGTAAGTVITNTAEITYTPEGTTAPVTTPSNPVTTTVLPVPSFTITPNDDANTDPTKVHYNVTDSENAGAAKPGDTVSVLYTLTNTGNVPSENYTLTNTPSAGTDPIKNADNVKFYPVSADTNKDGKLDAAEIAASAPITKITGVNQDQSVQFFQVITVPTTAKDGEKFGGDPTGNRDLKNDPKLDPTTPVPQDANNSNFVTVNRTDAVEIGPKDDSNADNKTDGTTTPNPVYTQPASGTDTTPDTVYPGGTSTPGSTTPVPADTQQVVDKCTTGTNVVTFTNTLKNPGNRTDVYDISAALPTGATKLEFLKLDGTTALTDTNGTNVIDTGSVAAGASVSFLVRVTYTGCLTDKLVVDIKATSGNDPSLSNTTKDEVLNVKLSFGDPTPTPGGDPTVPGTPLAGQPGNPATPVDPTKCAGTGTMTYIPMEVGNVGTVADRYNVEGTAPVKLTDGTTVTVPVVYYKDVNGNGTFDAGDTALADTNGDGKADTGYIQPAGEVKLLAAVNVPCGSMSQTIKLDQKATSPDTGLTVSDTNDTITVGSAGAPKADKAVDKATAKPGEELTYTIVGKNNSNSNVTKAMVCDTVPANTTFVSISAVTDVAPGALKYSNDGGATWSGTAPSTAGTKLCVGVDTASPAGIGTEDVLAPGKSITVTFKVKVN